MIDRASIKSLRVHPGLGVARVGNADGSDEFVLAGEVPGAAPISRDGAVRDPNGRLRRQGVRFRVYAEMKDGSVRELTSQDGVTISWTVQLANLKAGWYNFENAMDLPEPYAKTANRRNASVIGEDRRALDICPKARSISGVDLRGEAFHFDDGLFFGKPVYLGELRTDEAGRLIVLGGLGNAAARDPDAKPETFANNDGWHDDTSDGPVYAEVTLSDGSTFEAEPGFVVVAPPNYGPGLFGVVTMEDVVRDLCVRIGQLPLNHRCSFSRDIWPIFDRMTGLQWANHGLYLLSGHGSPLDARNDTTIARLSDASAGNAAFRQKVFSLFRDPRKAEVDPSAIPGLYGDYYGDYDHVAGRELAVTSQMFDALKLWAEGAFISDWSGIPKIENFEALTPAQQTDALDRASLHECLGGPFHPGIELTWFMRVPSMWKAPFRLAVLPRGTAVRQDFGDELTPAACLAKGGPLDSVGPGSLTRSLGVPWQTDEASCLSDGDYEPSTYLSFPSYWGARVPNRVLSSEAWSRATSIQPSSEQRYKHFASREDWLRDLKGSYRVKIGLMVKHWWELGVLESRTTPPEAVSWGLPEHAWVESGRPASVTGSNSKLELISEIENLLREPSSHEGVAPRTAKAHVPPRRRLRRDEV